MSEPVEFGRVSVVRKMTEDGHDFTMVTTSEGMSIIEALGMLRLAESTILREDDDE